MFIIVYHHPTRYITPHHHKTDTSTMSVTALLCLQILGRSPGTVPLTRSQRWTNPTMRLLSRTAGIWSASSKEASMLLTSRHARAWCSTTNPSNITALVTSSHHDVWLFSFQCWITFNTANSKPRSAIRHRPCRKKHALPTLSLSCCKAIEGQRALCAYLPKILLCPSATWGTYIRECVSTMS